MVNRKFSESRSGFFNLQDQDPITYEGVHDLIYKIKNLSDNVNRLMTMRRNSSTVSDVDYNAKALFIINECEQQIMEVIAPSAEENKVLAFEADSTVKEILANPNDPSFKIR